MPESRITVTKNKISLTGSPPYRVAPTVESAEALLNLPPMSDPEDGKLTIVSLLPKINPLDLRKLMTVIDTDSALREKYEDLKSRFCGIASVGCTSWPIPKNDEILDEVKLTMGPVKGMVCTVDGQRLIACEHRTVPKLLTVEEFKYAFGRPVDDVIKAAAKDSAIAIRQFAALITSEPVRYEISLVSEDFRAITKIVTAYSRDQLERYAKRTHQTITDIVRKDTP